MRCRLRRTGQVRHVVDLVLMQADPAHQVALHLVACGDRPDQRRPVPPALLCHGQDGRNVVARMAVLGREERVVVIEFAHRRAVCPRGPLGVHAHAGIAAEHGGTASTGVGQRLIAGGRRRAAPDGGDGDRRVVDDPVADHLGDVGGHRHGVGRGLGDQPRQLLLARQTRRLGVGRSAHARSSGPLVSARRWWSLIRRVRPKVDPRGILTDGRRRATRGRAGPKPARSVGVLGGGGRQDRLARAARNRVRPVVGPLRTLVPGRGVEHRRELPRPPRRRRFRRTDRGDRGQRHDGPSLENHLRRNDRPGGPNRRRARVPRGDQGRPCDRLHADDRRGASRHAGLRPAGCRAFGRVRGICRAGAGEADRRRSPGRGARRILWARAGPHRALQAATGRGDRDGGSQARRLPDLSTRAGQRRSDRGSRPRLGDA